MTSTGQPAGEHHLLRIGATPWRLWRECVLRSAGFPAASIDRLCDPELAELARRSGAAGDRAEFERQWPAALERSRAVLRSFADDQRFREAVVWQNPSVIRNYLSASQFSRRHELAIASYVQRYLVKNDTIGFFGPVGWASWTGGAHTLRVVPGPTVLARREVYFESWAIDALAGRLGHEPAMQPWLRPRLVASCLLDGVMLHRPHGSPIHLTADQAAALSRCDGTRAVRQLAAELATEVESLLAQLQSWQEAGVVHLDLLGPMEARPELTLRRKLDQIEEPGPRDRALAVLAEVEAARDRVAAAEGGDAVLAGVTALERVFEQATGCAATRRPGEAYAGRTLLYQDALRDVTVELGCPLAELLAPPLTLLLDSSRWLVARIADHYQRVLLDLHRACAERVGSGHVPLATLLAAATPYFMAAMPGPVTEAVAEFQRRWARVLRVPPDVRGYTVAAESLEAAVRAQFPASMPRWAAAICHSPDILVATPPGKAQWTSEDLTLVLGELHLARNTVESRVFVEFHERPDRLIAAVEADHGGRRVYDLPPREWPTVSPRTYPSPLLSPRFTYWCRHDDRAAAVGPVLPVAGMTVHRHDDLLTVRSRNGGAELDLMEMLGEQLSSVSANAFRLMPTTDRHRPRVTIGRLVVQREGWTFDTRQVEWVRSRDRAERFRLAQVWRDANQLPLRGFYQVPAQKPRFVDFRSVSLVELMAKVIRRMSTSAHPDRLSLTEMLPDTDQTWLVDAQGAGYAAELRCVAVDGGAADPRPPGAYPAGTGRGTV